MQSGESLAGAPAEEMPAARICYQNALAAAEHDQDAALGWLRRVADDSGDFAVWAGATSLLLRLGDAAAATARRRVRLAVLGSYTTNQLTDCLRLAAYRFGIWVEVYEAGYDQYQQEVLDETSGLYDFAPDVVLLAVHSGALQLPALSSDPQADVAIEADRWERLWQTLVDRTGARLIQHTFVAPRDPVYGNLAATLPQIRTSMIGALDRELAARAARAGVSIVDCPAVATSLGASKWFDDRYWHIAKQAVSLEAVPELARHTAAVLASTLGLTRKVLVLDLDDTLWGGIIGDDGLSGIVVGPGTAIGEAYAAFQTFCKALAERGVVLAVCSKNDEQVAREPFDRHPGMVLVEEDFAAFVANWQPKPDNLRRIAARLNVGTDALVLVDDNPGEREAVRQLMPDVEVIALPPHPAGFIDAVSGSLLFEAASVTGEDRERTRHYRARAATEALRETASSLDDFYRSLEMEARIAPVREVDVARVGQLIGKTNQFNLTARRHGEDAIRRFMADPQCVHLTVRLQDRFADHGLIAVVLGFRDGVALDIDTWVMSCRVIGRTVERTILGRLVEEARRRGLSELRGTYCATDRNGLVATLYADLGFDPVEVTDGRSTWTLDTTAPIRSNEFISQGE